MNLIRPDIPAAFGDIRHMEVDGRHLLMIGNCGGASIYYAANSGRAAEVLPRVTIQGQCQGASGGAVGYRGMAAQATIARLVRINGEYSMQLGVGETVDVTQDMIDALQWGYMWPQVAIDLHRSIDDLIQVVGSNHYSLIPGDCAPEITYACREAGIPVVRIDRA
jgi:L-fucose isomerase-like protein